MTRKSSQISQLLTGYESLTAREIGRQLGLSQATVSRQIKQEKSQILRLGAGRNTRYAALLTIAGIGSRLPLFRIDAQGLAPRRGELPQARLRPALADHEGRKSWNESAQVAQKYWRTLAEHNGLSQDFRQQAQHWARDIERVV